MTYSRRSLGIRAEHIACGFLKRNCLRIIKRNFRCRFGEIDIIAKEKDTLVFVEVRSASLQHIFMRPIESINYVKIERLKKLALIWLKQHKMEEYNVRFDVVTVLFKRGVIKNSIDIKYFKDVF